MERPDRQISMLASYLGQGDYIGKSLDVRDALAWLEHVERRLADAEANYTGAQRRYQDLWREHALLRERTSVLVDDSSFPSPAPPPPARPDAGLFVADSDNVEVWTVTHWPDGDRELQILDGPAPVLVYLNDGILMTRNADGEELAVSEYPEVAIWRRLS